MEDKRMYFNTTVTFPYDYQVISSVNPPPYITAPYAANTQIVLKNTGLATWQGEGSANPTRLAILNPDGRIFYDSGDSNWLGSIRVKMQEASVPAGQNAHFNFKMKGNSVGFKTMLFVPVLEGVSHMEDKRMYFNTTVTFPYSYQVVSSINPPATMSPGSMADVRLVLKNTGLATWIGEGSSNPVRIDMYNTDGRSFYTDVANSNWLGQTRIKMQINPVPSGQNATFDFKIKAPTMPGVHTMLFVPVLEGVMQFNNIGMYFNTTVQ